MDAGSYIEAPLRDLRLGGRRQAWREAGGGAGMPLVLLHGIGSNARAWAGQFAAFAAERRVIAWNAPGYAGSEPLPMSAPAPQDYAAALLALLDALAIGRFVLVGQSLGAIMATATALAVPERVRALVLASPASGYAVSHGDPLPEAVAARVREVEGNGPAALADRRAHRLLTERASPQARSIVHQAMSEVNPIGYRQASHMLAHADLLALVRGLTVPTTVLWGDSDIVTPPAGCASVAQAVPNGRWSELAGVGHAFATEAPDLFNAALRPVLDEADAKAGQEPWI